MCKTRQLLLPPAVSQNTKMLKDPVPLSLHLLAFLLPFTFTTCPHSLSSQFHTSISAPTIMRTGISHLLAYLSATTALDFPVSQIFAFPSLVRALFQL
jgi:hypothetical protein